MAEVLCPVAQAAHEAPAAIAVKSAARTWSYAEWDRRIDSVADALRSHGVKQGERVAILAGADESYLTLLVALFRMRAIACPLNTRWPADRIASVVTGPASATTEALRVQHMIADAQHAASLAHPRIAIEALMQSTSNAPRQPAMLDTAQHASIYFTSGSSGHPKAVLHRLGNHSANAAASNRNIPLGEGDCWLLSLPLYHVAGMGVLWRCILARAAIAVPHQEDLLEAIPRYGVTHVSLVTTQLHRMLQSEEAIAALRKLKAILLGGSAVSPALIEHAVALKLPLHKTYGLTETASQVATTRASDPPSAMHTSGTPIIEDSVRIDELGHILVRGETRFDGYLGHDGIETPFDPDGWFDTGDLGEWTDEGFLRVIGRADNMFVSGGENVQPEEIERALCSIEGVEEALVVPVSDDEFGQRGVAFVRGDYDEAAVVNELRHVLPGYMIPRTIWPWPAHLVEANAKISRERFRKHAQFLTAQAAREPNAPPPE